MATISLGYILGHILGYILVLGVIYRDRPIGYLVGCHRGLVGRATLVCQACIGTALCEYRRRTLPLQPVASTDHLSHFAPWSSGRGPGLDPGFGPRGETRDGSWKGPCGEDILDIYVSKVEYREGEYREGGI